MSDFFPDSLNPTKLTVIYNNNTNGDAKIIGETAGGQEMVAELLNRFPAKDAGVEGDLRVYDLHLQIVAPFHSAISSTPTEGDVQPYTSFDFGAKAIRLAEVTDGKKRKTSPVSSETQELSDKLAKAKSELKESKADGKKYQSDSQEHEKRVGELETENNKLKDEVQALQDKLNAAIAANRANTDKDANKDNGGQ